MGILSQERLFLTTFNVFQNIESKFFLMRLRPHLHPPEGDGRTFGEMPPEEKNKISHRARAFRALAEWLTNA
jgi:hypothetical protein